MEGEKVVIKVNNLTKKYDKALVLKNIELEIEEGDVFGIVGMSGSGKTTLLQLMIGFIKPTSGEIEYRVMEKIRKTEKKVRLSVFQSKNQQKIKRMYGFSSQLPSFYEYLTVKENLLLYGTLYKVPPKTINERAKEVMRLMGLEKDADQLGSNLSGGMQKKLDLGCSIIHNPKILFLDEPTAELDPVIRKQIWNLIKEIAKRGTTVILTSHLLNEIETVCTKIAILHDKKILGYGTLKELKDLFSKNQEIHVQTLSKNYTPLKNILKEDKRIKKIDEKEDRMIIYAPNAQEILSKVVYEINKAQEKIITLDVQDASLREIFELLTTKTESGQNKK